MVLHEDAGRQQMHGTSESTVGGNQMEPDTTKTCFVIMPFSDTTHGAPDAKVTIPRSEWTHIYENWIRKAVESYTHVRYACKRSPAQPGNFIKGIVQDLAETDLVVADLTGGRPNVYYELGIRHALKLGTVIITQDLGALPSDLNGYYAFQYTYRDKASQYGEFFARFEKELHEKFDAFNNGQVQSDSPVSDFLGFRAYLLDRQGHEDKQNLKWLVTNCVRAMQENYHTCEFLYQAFAEEEPVELQNWPVIDTYPIEQLLTQVASHHWNLFPDTFGASLSEVMREHRKLMLSIEQMWQVFRINPSGDAAQFLVDLLQYIREERRPQMEAAWKDIEKSLEDLGLSLVHKSDNGEEHVIAKRDFEKTRL